ncbi:MAG: ZIP family metal transporter [Cyclobacteriaceae bacterium]|jgi:zinc and cadmium transporter|nr:ZIP family metal transporter [Flammeovirgaceae bacterium]
MPTSIYILFFTALIAGAVAFYVPKLNTGTYKLWLVFAGSYLFSITIIHIFPELYSQSFDPGMIGICVLIGFFLQQALEFLSSGVEHGHIHVHEKNHQHKESSAILVLLALCVHAFLEGGLLAHPRTVNHHHDSNTLLWGIVLHKAPEAFALMSVLLCEVKSRSRAVFFLLIFALASPFGLFLSDYLLANQWMTSQAFTILFAIVSGNFLHISTTIVFESSADHKFNSRKMGVAVLATAIAVAAELLL